MLIDIHCHLEIIKNLDNAIKQSSEKGVKKILACGVNSKTNSLALKYSEKYSEVFPCLGLYPTDALKLSDSEINKEIEFIKQNKNKIKAISEIGLDLKESSRETLDKQKENFSKMIELGIKLNLPIIVHARKSEKEAIELIEEIIKKLNSKYNKVIMHCFMGNFKLVQKIIQNNWYLTAPTNIKNSQHFQEIVKICPIEQLFCETDSPFLHPDKEKNNIPGNVIESYKKIAEIKNLSIKQVKEKIENNYNKVFNT